MRTIAAEQFHEWLKAHGIGPDERYPRSHSFAYQPPPNEWERLRAPTGNRELAAFLGDVLDGIGPWDECLVWPRVAGWPDNSQSDQPLSALYGFMLAGAGIPLEFDGAVAFDRAERNRLIAVAAAPILFGVSVWEDVLLFPDHGKLFLQCDHHQDVVVTFFEPAVMEPFLAHMRAKGHDMDD